MAQKNTPVTKPKANIDFENELWNTRKLGQMASSCLRVFHDEDIVKEPIPTTSSATRTAIIRIWMIPAKPLPSRK
ncbi:MAG: hypothetical protein ACO1OF_22465 [Adhaeribacter sp.]